ncbi:hypothetical protein JTE90_018081 [Oedothorax gibbosus]|uniref:Uncharacterized protein n=1 Tax=Oedothorax gibbosus TaxID=931172 RepID=A0AAV6UC70_9ARAC|nr:hypothetical protein JTE90_018081 [Oedothorax gibbosus]
MKTFNAKHNEKSPTLSSPVASVSPANPKTDDRKNKRRKKKRIKKVPKKTGQNNGMDNTSLEDLRLSARTEFEHERDMLLTTLASVVKIICFLRERENGRAKSLFGILSSLVGIACCALFELTASFNQSIDRIS